MRRLNSDDICSIEYLKLTAKVHDMRCPFLTSNKIWSTWDSWSASHDARPYGIIGSLAFVKGIHRWSVNSPHKGPVTRKCFHLMSSWKLDFIFLQHCWQSIHHLLQSQTTGNQFSQSTATVIYHFNSLSWNNSLLEYLACIMHAKRHLNVMQISICGSGICSCYN